MLIGLTGNAQAGKDTAFKTLQKEYGQARRIALADQVKIAVATLLNLPLHEVEHLKTQDQVRWIPYEITEDKQTLAALATFNMRTLLQRMGTEVGRDLWGKNFWIDKALGNVRSHKGKLLVVTDVRYDNEARAIRDRYGVVFRIVRTAGPPPPTHASEVGVDPQLINRTFYAREGQLDFVGKEIARWVRGTEHFHSWTESTRTSRYCQTCMLWEEGLLV